MSQSTVGRYGPAPTARRHRAAIAAAWIGGALALALVVWLGIGIVQDPVKWSDVGFSVKGAERVDVTFEVTKDPESTVECMVHALNRGYAEVGVIRVTAGPATTQTVRHTVTVATQELAVTGLVDSCEVVAAG
ncbi:DUF4307 domain-containing protein [Pengzhenrongella sicca]|uniref:DUF4307 domain-containing protein n=1 Tax=Pengzhenrongella sicca TaxID=2819238 RepID=A0A8A4ZE81_9MICO|nr:DUF4307 domain-containing protein [Pengzhenrongella sicca]QTE28856.1 DUF4307 domain-containing protein [Pengzhenrongella sicca]